MKLEELTDVIEKAGGGENALAYAPALLEAIGRLEAAKQYEPLLRQLRSAGEQGDFRGRVLEVNFADHFLRNKIELRHAAKQGAGGDIDFLFPTKESEVFIELKLLGQDKATRESIRAQLDAVGKSSAIITDDTRDIARIQVDLLQKGSTTKFNPKPEKRWINLIGIDVSELQLGMADVCDCLLAAGGNSVAALHCDASTLRPDVVGIFEQLKSVSEKQKEWIDRIHKVAQGSPRPQEYIHGALFLFREPQETAALSYTLSGAIVWNAALISEDVAKPIAEALRKVIPAAP